MDRTLLRSPLAWLVLANILAVIAIVWLSQPPAPIGAPAFRVTPSTFDALPGWSESDPHGALEAFRRSCSVLAKLPPDQAMGWAGYAGTPAAWSPACKALPRAAESASVERAFFEAQFTPLAVGRSDAGHFTGYYEPQLSGSWVATAHYRVPVYGRPQDLVTADLGQFRHDLAGEHIGGRLEGMNLVPYPARADINAHGLPTAPILLYTDDPVAMFFLQIQGSGRVKIGDGQIVRLAFAGRNGRPYTSIGHVLVEQGALERKNVSLQSIRAWLDAHPQAAQSVMEADQSYVFFELAPLGDPELGSTGTEGVALTPGASLAIDPKVHPLGVPVYVATAVPNSDPTKPDRTFNRLLVSQDTGGAIKGPARGDIFFGSGGDAEAIAGRLNARGAFFVFVPKQVAARLAPFKEFQDAPR